MDSETDETGMTEAPAASQTAQTAQTARTADTVIEALGMHRHPEGGWYVETWRAPTTGSERSSGSAILYLLAGDERSHWHRVDAAEVWQWSAGEPLELRIWPGRVEAAEVAEAPEAVTIVRLGGDVTAGERSQAVVPAGAWQAARPLGAWALVGCVVTPAFEFDGFELAPDGWEPPISRRPTR